MSIEIDSGDINKKQVECTCVVKSKAFTVMVVPSMVDGSARVIEMYCLNCGKGVVVVDGNIGVKKVEVETDVYTDKFGKKHYCLKAETGFLTSGVNN